MGNDEIKLPCKPPLLFPEPRVLAGVANYNEIPYAGTLSSAKCILGAVYGIDEDGASWLEKQLYDNPAIQCRIILMVYPACPTREDTLMKLLELQNTMANRIRFAIYPVSFFTGYPANALLITCTEGKNYLCTGSSPNFGLGNEWSGEANFVLEVDAALSQQWQVFIDYMWCMSSPLNIETARIPKLIPAEGSKEAAEIWRQYMGFFPGESIFANGPEVDVDPLTGEVKAVENGKIVPLVTSEMNLSPYSPQLVELGSLYNQGSQVIVDKLTRIGPLDAPVKPDYFGMKGERRHGGVTRKTQYRISVLSQDDLKIIERLKNTMQAALDNMSYSLGDGVHWMPDTVRSLYQNEINCINSEGGARLKAIVTGDVAAYVNSNRDRLCRDLDNMYQEVNGGGYMASSDVAAILKNLTERLKRALEGKILPEVSYNSISFQDGNDIDQGSWGQAVRLLRSIALYSRKSITSERYFAMGLMVDRDELRKAMNVLDDVIYKEDKNNVYYRAKIEIEKVNEIVEDEMNNKDKCQALLDLIHGKSWEQKVSG